MNEKRSTAEVPSWTTGQVILATLLVVGVLLMFWLVYHARLVLFLFFAAIILGTALRPAVDWLRERGVLRPAGVIMIYLLITVLLVGFFYLVAPFFADQLTQFSQGLPKYYLDFRNWLVGSSNQLLHNIGLRIPSQVFTLLDKRTDNGQVLSQVAQTFLYANLVLKSLFQILAVFLLAYYWTQEGSLIIRTFLRFLPERRRLRAREFIHLVEERMGGYIRGQALLCLIVGSAAFVAYSLIGLPFAPVLGVIAGITELIPVIGPGLGAIPAVLIALSIDPTKIIWVLVATVLIQALENTLLVPNIMRSSIGVNPIIIMLSLVAFSSVFGLLGAIVALPAAAILQLIIDRALLAAAEAGKEPAGQQPVQIDELLAESQELALLVKDDAAKESPALAPLPRGPAEELRAVSTELQALLSRIQQEEQA
jgi:predicted PurR-regulated permease PerM